MATQEQIDAVKRSMGESENPWTDDEISALLDAGQTSDQILSAYWSAVAAETYRLTNISESGSSRSMGDVHKHALDLAKMYQARVDSSAVIPPEDTEDRGLVRFHRIRRV